MSVAGTKPTVQIFAVMSGLEGKPELFADFVAQQERKQ